MTTQEALKALTDLTSIFDYKPLLESAINEGHYDAIRTLGVSLTATCMFIAIVLHIVQSKGDYEPKSFFLILLQGFFIGGLLSVPTVYLTVADSIMGYGKEVSDSFLSKELFEFRGYFRQCMAQISGQEEQSLSIWNPAIITAPVNTILLSASFYLLVIVFLILISYLSLIHI